MEEQEIKQELDPNYYKQCRTCLSIGRELWPLGNYIEVYQKLTSHLENYNAQLLEYLQVCWECRALLGKAAQFQHKVKKAIEIFQLGQNNIHGPLSCLTTIVLNDEHPDTIYINSQISTQTDNKNTESNKDIENNKEEFIDEDACKEEFIDEDPCNLDDTETDIKIEIATDTENLEELKISKKPNRWSQKRAIQNKKPKFKMLTKADHDKMFRMKKIDSVELDKYLKGKEKCESYKSKKYKCTSCFIGFKRKCSLTKHNKKHHVKDARPYSCDTCQCHFKHKNNLTMHLSKHLNKYVCVVCAYETSCARERNEHAETHRNMYQCLKCDSLFGSRREFYKHFKEWHEKFVCDYCGISFKMRYCIKDHIKKQHSPFKCVPCNKSFARYNGLWLHNKIHHTESAVAGYCVECDKQYPDVYRYRWHVANSARHKPRKKSRIPCPSCDKVFSKNIYMRDHYNLVHLKQYKYRCEDCDKNFIRNADLLKHRRRVHEGILPPKNKICYMCGRGFTTNKILSNHVRTHTGERPFACAHCPARFAQSAALAGHARALHHRAAQAGTGPHVLLLKT